MKAPSSEGSILSEQVVITCTEKNFVYVNGHCVEKSSISIRPTPHPSLLLNQLLQQTTEYWGRSDNGI